MRVPRRKKRRPILCEIPNVYVLLDAPWDYGSYDPKQHITNRLDIEGMLGDRVLSP